ncbi:MAG: hypothetical protein RIC18_06490 [Hoeflea sp.]|uniref:hypothetical protein n=1 Tax=Hoeflea sp. TaxID=1940281 RepID=UPI0032EBF837
MVYNGDERGRSSKLVKSERERAVEALVPELTKPTVGAFVGTNFDGEFWGESSQDRLPFWLAIGSMQMDTGLAFNTDLKRDSRGGSGTSGQFYSLLGAYKLGRKTGIRAVIKPENTVHVGPLDRDTKLESIAFNDAFHISGAHKDAASSGDVPELELFRILTPATQDSMVTALKRYHNVGFVIDDDILFFMAQDKLVGENASRNGLDRLISSIVADFEKTKFGIKNYVE